MLEPAMNAANMALALRRGDLEQVHTPRAAISMQHGTVLLTPHLPRRGWGAYLPPTKR